MTEPGWGCPSIDGMPSLDAPSEATGAPAGDPRDRRIAELEAEVARLEDEVGRLKLDLWGARDAAIGATAEVGTQRVRQKELEALIHQLRLQVATLSGTGRRTPGWYVDRVARAIYHRVR